MKKRKDRLIRKDIIDHIYMENNHLTKKDIDVVLIELFNFVKRQSKEKDILIKGFGTFYCIETHPKLIPDNHGGMLETKPRLVMKLRQSGQQKLNYNAQ